ncbi:hypothetical protein [Paenibacillus sp. Marseille-Q4541]|nr:hypothetical protein [Paenibacillus sp. Marseille-Q4541]
MLSMVPIYVSLIKKIVRTLESIPHVVVDENGTTLRDLVEERLISNAA